MAVSPALKALSQALETRAFAPIYHFLGDDDFRKDEAVRRVMDAELEPSLRDFNLEQRRGGDLDPATLASLLDTPPMMSDRRVVVVREADGLRKGAREALARYCAKPAPDTVLVLVSPAGAKAEKGFAEGAVAVAFDALGEDDVEKWLAKRAKALGTAIEGPAASLLQSFAGNDLALLAQELEKLAAYTNGAPIGVAAVEAVVGVRPGHSMADLLDAVARRDAAAAVTLVPGVLAQPKTTAVQVVMALASQTLALGYLAARRAEGVGPGQLERETWGLLKGSGAYTGRPWPEAVSAWGHAAAKGWWSAEAAERALPALLEADLALKDSRVSSEEGVLLSLVLSLCG
ncbi:MAG: DNA polymerase III subunit delta [Gemmatimonadota bacterium]